MSSAETSETSATSDSFDTNQITPSHIVGIGASAGGLSALEQFFDNMPPDTGMAFVVIQHLSPDFKSLMDDLLSRHTSMPIHRVTNGIQLNPNSIYLIPPKTHMTVRSEKLYLTEKTVSPHTIELPIDIFFNSLAEDAGDRAVGVVLSGTGSDGSRGIISINKKGGLVVIQSPESAQFDGMPRNAISTGVCDFILAPDRIPRILVEYAISPLAVRTRMHHELEIFEDEGEYAGIFALLRRSYNLDFSKYKGSTVGRRIRRRMEFRQIPEVQDYAAIVSGDMGELDLLYKDLLIGVTEFFRDKQAFLFLEQEVIPRLFANLHRGEDLRVWSAACATGEEAYSLAILLAEKASELGFIGKITVFATDVHKTSLDFAAQGVYDRAKLTNVSPERMDKFFKKEGGDQFRVTSELRKLVVFAPHNLLNDPPFTRLDLVCCRNLLIYFQADVQEKVISLFHFALKIDSILFLGSSEGLGAFAGEFEVIANQHKLFRKIRDLKLALNLDANRMDRTPKIPVAVFQSGSSRTITIERQMLADYDTLLRRHMPPGVLLDENRQIIHYFGNVVEFLKMPEGRAENNILALAEDNLHIALSTSLQRADSTRQLVITRNVRIKRGAGDFLIDLHVSPLPDEKSHTTHYHVYFERVRQSEFSLPPEQSEFTDETNFDVDSHFRQHVADIEMELQSTRETLQTTVEELQTSNEELQATNEELLASNEELQSTNEELHSVNEELYSVNSEFERKNIELKQLNNDHENLLASTDIGTVFLDRQLRIRKYNPAIASFFKLLPQDIGRPIDNIAYHLSQQEEMLAEINRVLLTGNAAEQEEATRENRWLLRRIMPFRTETGHVEGVVITFTDITTVKHAEQKLARLNDELEEKVEKRTEELNNINSELLRSVERFQRAIQATNDGLWEWDILTNEEFFSPRWCEIVGYTPDDPELVRSYRSWEERIHPDDCERVRKSLSAHLENGTAYDVEYRHRHKSGEYRWQRSTGKAIFDGSGKPVKMVGCISDISERKKSEEELYQTRAVLQAAIDQSPAGIAIADAPNGSLRYVNDAGLLIRGGSREEIVNGVGIDKYVASWQLLDLDGRPLRTEEVPLARAIMLGETNNREFVIRRTEGEDRIVIANAAPIKDKDGLVTAGVVVFSDITDHRKAEEEKRIFEQQLQQTQKLESLGVLSGGIAHDFNNILAIIMGCCSLIKLNYETAERNIPKIENAAERAAGLCRQMLAYAGKATLANTQIVMWVLVDEVVAMLKASIGKNVVIKTRYSSDLPSFMGDANQLRQIVMNLIINASEAIGEVHGEVCVSLSKVAIKADQPEKDHNGKTVPPGLYVCVEVADNGCGMDDSTKLRIFEPFFTTKFTGRGLGMSAALGIIKAHGGALQLFSQLGQGSTFKAYLPVPADETTGVENQIESAPQALWRGSGTILLVEDEDHIRDIAKNFLEMFGFTVLETVNGREALEMYQKNSAEITLVFTDMGMPVMDGYELLSELKSLDPELPIIVSSGYGDAEVSERIGSDNIAVIISKPYNPNQLREVLKSVLDKRDGL